MELDLAQDGHIDPALFRFRPNHLALLVDPKNLVPWKPWVEQPLLWPVSVLNPLVDFVLVSLKNYYR